MPLRFCAAARQELPSAADCGGDQHVNEAEDELDTGHPPQGMAAVRVSGRATRLATRLHAM